MNDKIRIVLAGYLNLDENEKINFLKEVIKEQEKKDTDVKLNEDYRESVKRILGPLSTVNCTCCGR